MFIILHSRKKSQFGNKIPVLFEVLKFFISLSINRKCGEIQGKEWFASKDSGGMIILTFNSTHPVTRLAGRGFLLRADIVGKGMYTCINTRAERIKSTCYLV